MKSISVTVSILILTVFLSLSAPAYAGTANPYPVYGYVNYTDGTPADGELVTIYKAGDPSNKITAVVGSSYGVPGWWKADLYNIPVDVGNDTIVVHVRDKSITFVVNTATSTGGQWVSDVISVTKNGGDGSRSGGSSGGSGTYPPGWNEDAPTSTATPAPTTAATSEPTVAPTEAPTSASDGAPTEALTEAPTETPITKVKTKPTPGFGAMSTVFVIAGLLATYLIMRRRE